MTVLKYSAAADTIREAMLIWLWNEDKGRFARGFNQGQTDETDALDAASWGAMFLTAACEKDKTRQSINFAQSNYSSAVGEVSGSKPHAGMADGVNWDKIDIVWSEGSLGVAMSYLKMGDNMSLQQAYNTLAQMAKLQDPAGGLFYAWHDEPQPVPDFPEVPSVAGTGWYIMTVRAIEDTDTFWGVTP
jgi:hypothetical protein